MGAEYRTRHPQRKADRRPLFERLCHLKNNTTGRNILGDSSHLPILCGNHHPQCKRKTNRASNFLTGIRRHRANKRKRKCGFSNIHQLHPSSISVLCHFIGVFSCCQRHQSSGNGNRLRNPHSRIHRYKVGSLFHCQVCVLRLAWVRIKFNEVRQKVPIQSFFARIGISPLFGPLRTVSH